MKQFLSIKDVESVEQLIKEALQLKRNPFAFEQIGKNKTLGLIFLNPSLRTRLSSQKAALNLGMHTIEMNINKDGWEIAFEDGEVMNVSSQEHIKEVAAVIGQYCDILGVRTFASLRDRAKDYREEILMKFVKYAQIPVISLESASLHPLQSFADLITIEEYKKTSRPKVVLTWTPHPKPLPQAVANSFVEWMRLAPVKLVVAHPQGYDLAPAFSNGASVCYNQEEAFKNADFIYAKGWSAYHPYGKLPPVAASWKVTKEKMSLTNNAKFMHCLPVRRNVVVSDEVIDSENSLVIKQAANRVYSAQTVLKKILNT